MVTSQHATNASIFLLCLCHPVSHVATLALDMLQPSKSVGSSACSHPQGTRGTPLPIGQPEVRGAHGLIRLTEQRTWHHVSLSRDSVLFLLSSLSFTPGPWPVPFLWDGQDVRAAPAHSQLAIIGRGLVMCPVKMRVWKLQKPSSGVQAKPTSEELDWPDQGKPLRVLHPIPNKK
ncbi:hypothetical protein MRS44_008533 [Fusarium solani]|uniref:uncharacterized protein n=1 Tax=Fusarium solani TaxID=169388 RepID=UPI0032C3FAD7|nr:hypothetical protein MRS44_008533 [Fusarium solani]